MMDEPTRAEFSKTDGKNSAFDCGYVKGATLGLWKTEDGTDQTEPVAEWITDEEPHRLTHLPVGTYLWKEIQVPSGFVSHDPLPIVVEERSEIQRYEMKEDHTRVEVEKYCLENGKDPAGGKTAVGGCGSYLPRRRTAAV